MMVLESRVEQAIEAIPDARKDAVSVRLVDDAVRAEQVQVIYQQAKPAMFISVLVAGLVCSVLAGVADHGVLAAWFGAVGAAALIRLAFAIGFTREALPDRNFRVWEKRFVWTLALTGLVWGVGGWLIMPRDSLAYQAVVYCFLMGMAGGAVASYSAHFPAVTLAIVTVMLPSTLWFALQDSVPLRAMAAGGVLYVAAAYRATRTLAFFVRRSFQLSHELRAARHAAERLARTDALTGLANRRAFYELGQRAFDESVRYAHPVSIVMLDVDRFKSINDTHGHAAGDRALQRVAELIAESTRASDVAGRVGGEEFAILLTHTSATEAFALAERLRTKLAETSVEHEGETIRFTASLGVAERDERATSFYALIANADAALYRAKHEGRDKVVGG